MNVCDYGITQDEFIEFINEEYYKINKGLKNNNFKIRLKTVLNFYKIENDL